jgi:hypothetical protein
MTAKDVRRQDEFRDRVRAASVHGEISACVLLISGCQDSETSLDVGSNGLFTKNLVDVWANGTFKGNYRQFHKRVQFKTSKEAKQRHSHNQNPNYYLVGNPDANFLEEVPFTISPESDRSAKTRLDMKQKAKVFVDKVNGDAALRARFCAQPVDALLAEGILTALQAQAPVVKEYYTRLAKKFSEQPNGELDLATRSFWSDAKCWSCKIGLGAVIAGAVAAATVATGGFDIPILAAAAGISEGAATAAVAVAGGGTAELVSLILTSICGC